MAFKFTYVSVLTFILDLQVEGPECVQQWLYHAVMGCVHFGLEDKRKRELRHVFFYCCYVKYP